MQKPMIIAAIDPLIKILSCRRVHGIFYHCKGLSINYDLEGQKPGSDNTLKNGNIKSDPLMAIP